MKTQEGLIEIGGKTEETELMPAGKINVQDLFIEQKGLNKLLASIKKKAYSFGQDVTTNEGREVVRSTAYKIARSRTFLDGLGKDVVKKEKERVTKANNTRKKIKEETEKMQTEYRQPLTDYEEKEKKAKAEEAEREKKKIEARIAQLQEYRCVLPYQQVATMSDEEFDEVLNNEKEAYEKQQAEAEQLKKDQEKIEKEKAEIRAEKISVLTMRLTGFGFECEDNYFSFKIEGSEVVGVSMNDLVDLSVDDLNLKLIELAEKVDIAEREHEESKQAAAAEEDKDVEAEPIDIKTEALGTFETDTEEKQESVLSQTVKELIEVDINVIHTWIDVMKSIAKKRPTFEAQHSDTICSDIADSFIEFFDKTKELVIQELR